jgi:putative cell wall-binding protein
MAAGRTNRQERRALERANRSRTSNVLRSGAKAAGTAAVVGSGLAVVPAAPASAATVTVTSALDDGSPGTLRSVIADAGPGDIVEFDPSVTHISLASGDIEIDKSLSIAGPGRDGLTIDAGGTNRIFTLDDGDPAVQSTFVVSGMTLSNGYAAVGGAIYANAEALAISDTLITGNDVTDSGGAVAVLGHYVGPGQKYGSITISDSVLSSNTAGYGGGAVFAYGVSLDISGSIFTGNSAELDANAHGVGGGAIFSFTNTPALSAMVLIDDSTFSGNVADPLGDGVGGAISASNSGLGISDSTLTGNSAYLGGGIAGRAQGGPPKYIQVLNTTISGNDATAGGGVYLYGDTDTTFISATISANSADVGGGILDNGGATTLGNTIVSGNTASSEPDVLATSAFDSKYSMLGTTDPGTVTDNGGNIFDLDPLLGALVDNGGPTRTMKPAYNSPAVDAGDPETNTPFTDQRTLERIVRDRVDIGAVELTLSELTPPAPPEPDPGPPPTTTTTRPPAPEPVEADVPPPAEPGGSSEVEIETEDGAVNIEIASVEEGDDLTITVTVIDEEDADVDTTGFSVQGRIFEVEVTGGDGDEGGTVCFPYEPDADATGLPHVIHFVNGEPEVLESEVVGDQICATTSSFSPFAIAVFDTTRLAGVDAASTAAAISEATFEPGVEVAYVVSRSRVSDAAAAGAGGGPVLLVNQDSVPSATAAELARLDAARVVVVGGTSAVSDAVVAELGATRLAGADRYETAAALADDAFDTGVPVAYVVNGESVPDALVAAAAASAEGGPVLLVTRDVIPDAVGAALESLQPARVVVIGGTGVVSDEVVAGLAATRIAGVDRYATAAALAEVIGSDMVSVARGDDPIDGLAGAPMGLPLLLVQRDAVPAVTDEALSALDPATITVLGGSAAISFDTELDLARYLTAE